MRVLIVDDFRDGAESLAALVEMLGHSTRTVYDGPSALAVARTWQPEVILLDIAMPAMDGYTVAAQVRQEAQARCCGAPRIVAISGYPADEGRRTKAGIAAYYLKPVGAAAIRRAIEG